MQYLTRRHASPANRMRPFRWRATLIALICGLNLSLVSGCAIFPSPSFVKLVEGEPHPEDVPEWLNFQLERAVERLEVDAQWYNYWQEDGGAISWPEGSAEVVESALVHWCAWDGPSPEGKIRQASVMGKMYTEPGAPITADSPELEAIRELWEEDGWEITHIPGSKARPAGFIRADRADGAMLSFEPVPYDGITLLLLDVESICIV